jgi:hypothetical protein
VGTLSLHTGRVVGYYIVFRYIVRDELNGMVAMLFLSNVERGRKNGRIRILVLAKSNKVALCLGS